MLLRLCVCFRYGLGGLHGSFDYLKLSLHRLNSNFVMFSSTSAINTILKITNYVKKNQVGINVIAKRLTSTEVEQLQTFKDDTVEYLGEQKTSPAMISYLKRAKANAEFMEKHTHEFQVGKRHLANMMGKDPETFTQNDIDEAIEYLFPSGLFEKQARTMMKPPEAIFPSRKEAEFDENGRPHHWLFYTALPNFYNMLYDIVFKMKELDSYEDEQVKKGLDPPENSAVSMGGMEWLPKNILEKRLLEELSDDGYRQFVNLMDRFIQHPYAFMASDHYDPLRKSLLVHTMNFDPETPQYTKDGTAYVTTKDCPQGSARAEVTVYHPGTGKLSINGEDLFYFSNPQSREQILFPLLMSNMLNKVDIVATVVKGGTTNQASAIRYGISWGLRNFVDEETRQNMILAGLLSKDYRRRERKKPGQEGARRKFTWKKR